QKNEKKLIEKEERRKAEIAKKILHKRELFNAEYAGLRDKMEEIEKNRQQQQMLREKRLHSLEHAREVRAKQIYERKAAEEQKNEKKLIEKEERRKAEIAKKILHERELFNAEYAGLRDKMEEVKDIATEEHKNILKKQKQEAEKQEKALGKKQKEQHRINKRIKIIEQKVFEAYAHLRLMDIKKAIILYQQAVKLRNNLPIKDKLRLGLPLSRVKAMIIQQRKVLLNELKAKKLMYNTNESKLSKLIEDNDEKNIKQITQLKNEQKILRNDIRRSWYELKGR
ncbi:hypothetical protein HYU06_02835, partial [Candidatus Woesearchaeota archaeon]|nr:hypothetical protein [Candidatus Woesearchaeota archaeon]